MARLWLAAALCALVFIALANDAEGHGHHYGHRHGYHHHKSKGACKSKGRNIGHHHARKSYPRGNIGVLGSLYAKKGCSKRRHKSHSGHKHGHGLFKAFGDIKKCGSRRRKHGLSVSGNKKSHSHSHSGGRSHKLNINNKRRNRSRKRQKHGGSGSKDSSGSSSHHVNKNNKRRNGTRKRQKHGGSGSKDSSGSSSHHVNKNNKRRNRTRRQKKRGSSSSSSSSSGGNSDHQQTNTVDKKRPVPSKKEHPCRSNPCQNGAECYEKPNGDYTCSCKAGFRGTRCEQKIVVKVRPCDSNPCLNHGQCIPSGSGYRCRCERGFAGENCQIVPKSFDPCAGVVCHNGGTCYAENGEAKCKCRTGFKGTLCRNKVDRSGACANNPCKHNGDCHEIDNGNTFYCNCMGDWEGVTCQIAIDHSGPCDNNPCAHGHCVPSRNIFRCLCSGGYTGDLCDVPPKKDPCLQNPCLNNGQCISLTTGDFNCKCRSGFEGAFCETGKMRPGLCPISNTGNCVRGIDGCNSDSECPGEDEKCCSTGCSRVCRKPCRGVCYNFCPNGFVYDNDGCPTCQCKELPLPPKEEVVPPKPKVADQVGKENIAFNTKIDLSKTTRVRLSVIWDDDLRISFKHPNSPNAFYVIYIGWETARIERCSSSGTCKMVRDVNTKGILKKSPVESINFYIIISPEGDFIIGLDNPDYELMSYNDPNPVTGFANMYIFAGGVYPVDWTVATPTIEDSPMVQIDTDGRDTVVDLQRIRAIDVRQTVKIRFSVIHGEQLQIGLKSTINLKKYIIIHIGKESSHVEECNEDEECTVSENFDTAGNIASDHFVNYFILFRRDGSVSVVYEDTQTEFITYSIIEPREGSFNVFISSGHGGQASWKVHQSTTIQEDTITLKPHPIEQNDKTWTFITEPLRSFEKEIQVGLAADAQIHIVLTGDKEKADSAYEIIIGAESNTKVIVKKGSQSVSANHVLSSGSYDDYSDYWIGWSDGNLCVGDIDNYKKNDALACIAVPVKDQVFTWAGFKGDMMDYIIYYSFEYAVSYGIFSTYDSNMAYPLRFKRARMTNNVLEFGVMTDSDAHMAVSNCQGADTPTAPMYELVMGTQGSEGCLFRRCKGCEAVAEGACPGLLDETEPKDYTFEFNNGHLKLHKGRGVSKKLLLEWDDPNPIQNVGHLATATGFQSSGTSRWILYHP